MVEHGVHGMSFLVGDARDVLTGFNHVVNVCKRPLARGIRGMELVWEKLDSPFVSFSLDNVLTWIQTPDRCTYSSTRSFDGLYKHTTAIFTCTLTGLPVRKNDSM